MSMYYRGQRGKGLYVPGASEPFRLSRSKIDLFVQCPRCFYLDQRLGVARPPGFPMTLNNAVDLLLKKEFDIHRDGKTTHPLMKAYGIDAVPFQHPKMEEWRDALRRGISTYFEPANLIVRGGVDDVWVNPKGELIIVDYKATSKDEEITLDAEWKIQYKRQMEIYQWLFRRNAFTVSETGYFVYVNGKTDRKAFDGKLEFDVTVIPYKGDDGWIPEVLMNMKACLEGNEIPAANAECDFCTYRECAGNAFKKLVGEKQSKKSVAKPKVKKVDEKENLAPTLF